jgi:hypothetical protein
MVDESEAVVYLPIQQFSSANELISQLTLAAKAPVHCLTESDSLTGEGSHNQIEKILQSGILCIATRIIVAEPSPITRGKVGLVKPINALMCPPPLYSALPN